MREQSKHTAISIWLQLAAPELVRRIRGSWRYLAKVGDPAELISEQLATRSQYYAQTDLSICCDGLSPEETAKAIVRLLPTIDGLTD